MFKIDASQLQTYIDCPRRYYNRYVRCLRKVGYDERDIDREFGKCFHSAIEILHKTNNLEQAKNVFKTQFNPIEANKAKTPANGEKLVEAYRNYWSQPVNDLADTNITNMTVEATDSFRLADDVEWIVKIDRVGKNNAGIWNIDTKTTSKVAYNYFRKFDLDMKTSGYCEYVRQKYGQCSGAIIDVASVGYRERSYKGEPAGFWCEFARDITNRNEAQLHDFRDNALFWTRRLICDLQTSNDGLGVCAFGKNTMACNQFKGCGFRELCLSLDDESVMETLYEKYNPLEYLETK